MLKRITPYVVALTLCSTLANASPQSLGPQSHSAIAIYQNSSTEIRIEQLSSRITKLVNSSGSNQVINDKIKLSIENAYHPSRFEAHIIKAMDSTLNWQERKKIVEWLDSPLGRKASLAEAVAFLNAGNSGIAATIEKAKGLESASKAKLVDVAEMAAMESALQLEISVFQKSIGAFATSAPQSLTSIKDYSSFYTAAQSRRNELSSLNQTYSRSLMSLAYAELSKPETKAMISFYGSPTGTRFSVALRTGIANAFEDANRIFNNDVKNIIASSTVAYAN